MTPCKILLVSLLISAISCIVESGHTCGQDCPDPTGSDDPKKTCESYEKFVECVDNDKVCTEEQKKEQKGSYKRERFCGNQESGTTVTNCLIVCNAPSDCKTYEEFVKCVDAKCTKDDKDLQKAAFQRKNFCVPSTVTTTPLTAASKLTTTLTPKTTTPANTVPANLCVANCSKAYNVSETKITLNHNISHLTKDDCKYVLCLINNSCTHMQAKPVVEECKKMESALVTTTTTDAATSATSLLFLVIANAWIALLTKLF